MRILITGDRYWANVPMAMTVLDRLVAKHGPGITIVEGGASGIDDSFRQACRIRGVACETFHARWDELGRRAGPARNAEMVAAGADLCLAFHQFLPGSKGTKDCCLQAIGAGVPTWLVERDGGRPIRLRADNPRLE